VRLRPPAHDAGWVERVVAADVRLDLFDAADDDYAFALLGVTIVRAVSDSALSDDDAYPLLVRFWNGDWPLIDWPEHAPAVARRCAAALAHTGRCKLDGLLYAPSDESLRLAREAIVTELGVTPGHLLAAVAERWDEVADFEMPVDGGCSLLAFACHVLLEPLVGACALIWSTLDSPASPTAVDAASPWDEWSPVDRDDWMDAAAAELIRLGHPAPRPPADADDAAHLLACARAALLRSHDGARLVAASIVRMSGWPGATDIIDPIAARAVDCALDHVNDVDAETDNEALVDAIQELLLPGDEALLGWVRDPSFGALRDHGGSARTGAEMLDTAADWLTWSIARASIEVTAAIRRPPHSAA
jgi:hypothetical protein